MVFLSGLKMFFSLSLEGGSKVTVHTKASNLTGTYKKLISTLLELKILHQGLCYRNLLGKIKHL